MSGGGALAALVLPLGPGRAGVPVPAASAGQRVASATLHLADGTKVGSVRFLTVQDRTTVKVTLDVPGCCGSAGSVARDAFHGIHVHANDDPGNGAGCVANPWMPANTWFTAVDGHLKHGDQAHGAHAGDLPPLLVDQHGRASTTFSTDRLTADELVGKAVILHAGADNLGNVPVGFAADQYTANSDDALTKTRATGNAGDRVACGVIHRGT
jgi:Cu-Zn family superoxide dismutase